MRARLLALSVAALVGFFGSVAWGSPLPPAIPVPPAEYYSEIDTDVRDVSTSQRTVNEPGWGLSQSGDPFPSVSAFVGNTDLGLDVNVISGLTYYFEVVGPARYPLVPADIQWTGSVNGPTEPGLYGQLNSVAAVDMALFMSSPVNLLIHRELRISGATGPLL